MTLYDDRQIVDIVEELRSLPHETGYVEFKTSWNDPGDIGQYIAALSNAAALESRERAFVIWGVDDTSHDLVGTEFEPFSQKKGNEDLIPWLQRGLNPQVHFEFFRTEIAEKQVVLLAIAAAAHAPIQFYGIEYIRVGSYRKQLKDYPDHAKRLWASFSKTPFERRAARDRVDENDILRLLDYPAYFELTGLPLPDDRAGIVAALLEERLILHDPSGYSITNLGAALFARDLREFDSLERKVPRVVIYSGNDRTSATRIQSGQKGYAAGFQGLVGYISAALPAEDVIILGKRESRDMFPEIIVRELVANALIHQDFSVTGSGPLVEIFTDRFEVTNPGTPIVDVSRLINAVPRSRNADLATLMTRMGFSEELGTGWDKIAKALEQRTLPAPRIESADNALRVTVLTPRPISDIPKDERANAVYLHACLKWAQHERATNASVRERFGFNAKQNASASRLIREALDAGLIAPYDPGVGLKAMSYVPAWTKSSSSLLAN